MSSIWRSRRLTPSIVVCWLADSVVLLRGRAVLQGWASDGDGEGAAQLDEQMVRDFHFGGGLFERKEGTGGEEGAEEGEEDGRQQKKSKKEVGAGAAVQCCYVAGLGICRLCLAVSPFLAKWRPVYFLDWFIDFPSTAA